MVVCWDCILLFGYVCWKWWYDDVVFNEWIGRVVDRENNIYNNLDLVKNFSNIFEYDLLNYLKRVLLVENISGNLYYIVDVVFSKLIYENMYDIVS